MRSEILEESRHKTDLDRGSYQKVIKTMEESAAGSVSPRSEGQKAKKSRASKPKVKTGMYKRFPSDDGL